MASNRGDITLITWIQRIMATYCRLVTSWLPILRGPGNDSSSSHSYPERRMMHTSECFMSSERKQHTHQSQILITFYGHQHIHLSHLQFPPALMEAKIINFGWSIGRVYKQRKTSLFASISSISIKRTAPTKWLDHRMALANKKLRNLWISSSQPPCASVKKP